MSDQRQRELARIHCLKKELDLDDATYRTMLSTVADVASASQLDNHGRQQVIEHLQARRGGAHRQPQPSADREPLVRKIQAQLADLGVDEAYADAIARQMHGIQRWRWCSPPQLRSVTAALWYRQRRQGRQP